MSNDNNMVITKTILSQLGGSGRLSAMIGAYNLLSIKDGLSFKFKGSRKHNYCKVAYDHGKDLYTMTIAKVTVSRTTLETSVKNEKVFEDVYCDQLVELFEQTTKLYLSI